MLLRAKALFDCAYFGLMPSIVYEEKCHYADHDTYWSHMKINIDIAKNWLKGKEDFSEQILALTNHTYINPALKRWGKDVIHNAVAHPLMIFMSPEKATEFHDRNATWAYGLNRYDELRLEGRNKN